MSEVQSHPVETFPTRLPWYVELAIPLTMMLIIVVTLTGVYQWLTRDQVLEPIQQEVTR